MRCSNCGKQNPAGSRFCQFCGASLVKTEEEEQKRAIAEPQATSPSKRPPAQQKAGPPQADSASPLVKMGEGGMGLVDIWGPFAGHGERGHHASWLLDGLAGSAEDLHDMITERFRQREIPGASMGWQGLQGRGLGVERRPFYLIRRGITTVALYVGKFGRDLFISQVTYTRGPISNVRIVILAVMILFQLYYVYGYTSSIVDALGGGFNLFGSGPDFGALVFLFCIVGPLGFLNSILLGLAFLYSVYKFLKEKDFLALLRVPPNEFQLDDIIALEKSVEETVRQALDSAGIDPGLMPAAPRKEYKKRLI